MSPLLAARDVVRSLRRDARARRRRASRSTRARSSRSWGRRARASRRCCTASPASSRPTRAPCAFDGRELTAMSDRERSALRRRDFGFVFQFGQLVPELDCRENAALPLRLEGVRRREAERRATAWLERLEVADARAQAPGRDLRRRGPARRGGAGAGDRAAGAVRRRADRRARLAQRRARDGAAHGGRARARRRGRARHPRAARRRLRRPRGRRPRRAHADGGAGCGGVPLEPSSRVQRARRERLARPRARRAARRQRRPRGLGADRAGRARRRARRRRAAGRRRACRARSPRATGATRRGCPSSWTPGGSREHAVRVGYGGHDVPRRRHQRPHPSSRIGPRPPHPPGVDRLPAAGRDVRLAGARGAAARAGLGAAARAAATSACVGTIGREGLHGPGELAFLARRPAGQAGHDRRRPLRHRLRAAADRRRCSCSCCWSASSSCSCPSPRSWAPRRGSAARRATGGSRPCASSAPTAGWPGGSPPARCSRAPWPASRSAALGFVVLRPLVERVELWGISMFAARPRAAAGAGRR